MNRKEIRVHTKIFHNGKILSLTAKAFVVDLETEEVIRIILFLYEDNPRRRVHCGIRDYPKDLLPFSKEAITATVNLVLFNQRTRLLNEYENNK